MKPVLSRFMVRLGPCLGVAVSLVIVPLVCLGQLGHPPAAAEAPLATREVEIATHGFYFDPRTATVPLGTNVTWRNLGAFTHTTDSDSGVWDSGEIAPGDVFRHTFGAASAFPYHCDLRPGMTGAIVMAYSVHLPIVLRQR